ncbi:MAG: hypothetical protein MJZ11_09415 [Lachnospiraceae bacterium]|nr:hypothetical protein [Lachnospiraceae bacterium]
MKKIRLNRTVFELWVGILMFAIVGQIVAIFIPNPGKCSLNLWIGTLTALIASFHMWWSLDRALSFDNDNAVKSIRIQFLLRYLFLIAVMGVCGVFFGEYVLAAFFGITGIKIGAYLQPLTKKISTLIYGEEILPPRIEYIDDKDLKETAIEQK